MITLVTGGARSGKSKYALQLADRFPKKVFIATAEACDEEMRRRIQRHRQQRGECFATFEEPVDLAGALRRLPGDTGIAVVDCLTVWLGNLYHRRGLEPAGDLEEFPEIGAFLAVLEAAPCPLVLVTNEVGLGVIAADPMTRSFVELAGRLNQEVAARAERVVLLVSGLPLALKGGAEWAGAGLGGPA
jgi:adenosylcobinamide kinase/adenosylcobinamide-phosphate guanylyltransferase